MGKEWISLDELKFPPKCPYCNGQKFRVEGARKVLFEAVYKVIEGGLEREEDINTDIEWEVAYSLICEECSKDLSGEVGL